MSPPVCSPTEIAPVMWSAADPLPGYRFLECIARNTTAETWTAQANDGRGCLIRLIVRTNGADEKEQEGLNRLRSLRHDVLEPMELVSAGAHRLAVVTDSCSTTLATRLEECQEAGMPGIPRAELLARLTQAAEALDDLFEEHGVRHLALTPKHFVLRNTRLLVRHFGLAELIHFPAGHQAAVLNPRYAAPEVVEGDLHPASDAYSLAVVFCELLTGVNPLGSLGPRQHASSRRRAQPDLSLVPSADRLVLQRALQINPNRRFPCCTDLIAALTAPAGPSVPVAAASADPSLAIAMRNRMRQLINGLVAEAASDVEVREYRNARYLLRPGRSVEHQFFARLAPGVAALKIDGFRFQWGASPVDMNERRAVLHIPAAASFWRRLVGKNPGVKVQIDLPEVASSAVSEVRVRIEPVDCGGETALTLMEENAPQLMDSLRTFFQAHAERRNQARLPFNKEVQIVPMLDQYTEGEAILARARDISMQGMRVQMPCQPRSQQVNVRLAGAPSDHPASLPACVVRLFPCGGGYEVGLRFLIEESAPRG